MVSSSLLERHSSQNSHSFRKKGAECGIHNGQAGDIEAVMVDGRFLMRDGRVLTMDEETIIREADKIGRRAWNQLLERYPSAPFPTRVAPRL
jgi:hypothetical protein